MTHTDELIGKYARNFRITQLNISQQEMADRIGMSRQSINNFEQGRNHSYKAFNAYMKLGMTFPQLKEI